MAKLADAADLKSADPKGLWGFKSPSRHQDKLHKISKLQRIKPLSPRGFFMLESAGDTSGDTLLFWFQRDIYAEKARASQGSLGARTRK